MSRYEARRATEPHVWAIFGLCAVVYVLGIWRGSLLTYEGSQWIPAFISGIAAMAAYLIASRIRTSILDKVL